MMLWNKYCNEFSSMFQYNGPNAMYILALWINTHSVSMFIYLVWFISGFRCSAALLPLLIWLHIFNTLNPVQNGRHFLDECHCLEWKWIHFDYNSLKFVPALVRIMAWGRPGVKPLSEPISVSLLTHICVTHPQSSRHECIFVETRAIWCENVTFICYVALPEY